MPDWTNPHPTPSDPPPGKINPPPADQIRPTDPGWSDFVNQQTAKANITWSGQCWISLDVQPTGVTMTWPIDGDNPTDFGTNGGWKEDSKFETQPPDAYQDFTRWMRHYPRMRTQKYAQYKATVYVNCHGKIVNTFPDYFWVADGQPETGPQDVYFWTKTSWMVDDGHGHTYKRIDVPKPPNDHMARPDASWLGPHETPPFWLLIGAPSTDYKIDLKFKPKLGWSHDWDKESKPDGGEGWKFKPKLDWHYFFDQEPRFPFPTDPNTKIENWVSAAEFAKTKKPAAKTKRRKG
jgi:hypothetical protein